MHVPMCSDPHLCNMKASYMLVLCPAPFMHETVKRAGHKTSDMSS